MPPSTWDRLTSLPMAMTIDAFRPGSVLYRALISNPGTNFYVDPDHVVLRDVEVPSGGGIAPARAVALAYDAFTAAGGPLDIRQETVTALAAPATPARKGSATPAFTGR